MKILCLNLTISEKTTQSLLANQFSIVSAKKNNPEKMEPHDILFFAPENDSSLAWLKDYRQHHPKSWVTLVVEKSEFKKTEWVNSLLQSHEKNEILVQEVWELLLWFSLQKSVEHQKNQELTEAFECLSQTSETLISQLEHDISLATNIQRGAATQILTGHSRSFVCGEIPTGGRRGRRLLRSF